jgi:hypothetical protein
VLACLVEIVPQPSFAKAFPNYTSFKSAGSVRELDAQQVLRACHVGGMFDARTEINIYRLFQQLERRTGPWIGAPIKLTLKDFTVGSHGNALDLADVVTFESCEAVAGPAFLSIREGTFEERTTNEEVISEVRFEYVLPQQYSLSSASVIPVRKTAEGVFVGIEQRDLPAVQAFTNTSRIATVPAWRIPKEISHLTEVPGFLGTIMRRDFNLTIEHLWELGGPYFTSPGVTPEVVFPFVAEVAQSEEEKSDLIFVELAELRQRSYSITDAHLLLAIHRLTHALQE